mgnify:CR=1 FL=1
MSTLAHAKPVNLSLGSKSLAFDSQWSRPAISDIETMILRFAAFPEVGVASVLNHEFIFIDPSTSDLCPQHQDQLERLVTIALRLGLPHAVIAHQDNNRFGGGGFINSVYELAQMSEPDFQVGFAKLRERLNWVLAGSRFNRRRHLVFPHTEGATLEAVLELLPSIPAGGRPFVHMVLPWSADTMPNQRRFGSLDKHGPAIAAINRQHPSLFLYSWSRGLANTLAREIAAPVQVLDPAPELSLRQDGETPPDRFTVAFMGAMAHETGFDQLPSIIRAANHATSSPGRLRFVVQQRPSPQTTDTADLHLSLGELLSIPERNVSVIEDILPRHLYYNVIRQADGILLPYSAHATERYSDTALHAMAAGKLVFAFDDVPLAHVNRARVMRARNTQSMGEIISDMASDIEATRIASRAAKDAFWTTSRPARLFAQLLYGPMILAKAEGHEAI